MGRRVDAPRLKIKPQALRDLTIQNLLLLDRVATPPCLGLHPARLRHRFSGDFRQLRLQRLKQRRHLARLCAPLVETEQCIIRLVFVAEQLCFPPGDAQHLFQVWRKPGKVGGLPRFDPRCFRMGADFTFLPHQLLRQLCRPIKGPAQLAHIRRLRRIRRHLRLRLLQKF